MEHYSSPEEMGCHTKKERKNLVTVFLLAYIYWAGVGLKCTLLREKGQSENATFSDSNYVAFWKWQNYKDNGRSEVSRSLRKEGSQVEWGPLDC